MTHVDLLARKVFRRTKTPPESKNDQFYLIGSCISIEANHGKSRRPPAIARVKRLFRSGTRTSALPCCSPCHAPALLASAPVPPRDYRPYQLAHCIRFALQRGAIIVRAETQGKGAEDLDNRIGNSDSWLIEVAVAMRLCAGKRQLRPVSRTRSRCGSAAVARTAPGYGHR